MELPVVSIQLEAKPASYVDLPPDMEDLNAQIAALGEVNALLQKQVQVLSEAVAALTRRICELEVAPARDGEQAMREWFERAKQRYPQFIPANITWTSSGVTGTATTANYGYVISSNGTG